MRLKANTTKAFQKKVWGHYNREPRTFPWRSTKNPYRILISEIMLQQTQTDRVVGYYQRFLKRFPTFKELGAAPLAEVLSYWQGLGYNRRARYLWQLAKTVEQDFKGKLPRDPAVLQTLPGIGSYTAHAIVVFAFNQALPMIETNIRAVYIDHFFTRKKIISDKELMPLIEQTLDSKNPREWFYALMDYGSALKKMKKSLTKRSAHYIKQSPFKGSNRQLRGAILRELLKKKTITVSDLSQYQYSSEQKKQILNTLCKDRMIIKVKSGYRLAEN